MRSFFLALVLAVGLSAAVGADILAADQEEWIAASTVRDIAEMLTLAAAKKAGHGWKAQELECVVQRVAPGEEKYSVAIKSPELAGEFKCDVVFRKCVYETSAYAGVASDLLKELKLAADASGGVPAEGVLRRLSDNSMGGVHEENGEISAALNANPLNPDTHEEAALLWSVFNLNGLCGPYTDSRFGITRAVAHLAVAGALRGDGTQSFCGKVAEAAQCGMSSRDTETVQRAEQLLAQAGTPVEKSWGRTMKIVGTNNPAFMDKENFTGVEEYQAVKRIAFFESSDNAAKYLAQRHAKPNIQWYRLINNNSMSVGSGQIFTMPFFRAEMTDFSKDAQLWGKRSSIDWKSIAPDLNLLPTRCVVNGAMEVISYADVAELHQRQLLQAFDCLYSLMDRKWAVKAEAAELRESVRKNLGEMRLFAFDEIYWADEKDAASGKLAPWIETASAVVKEAPHLVPMMVWLEGTYTKEGEGLKTRAREWFGELPLFGTAYDFWGYDTVLHSPKLDLREVSHLRDVALCNRLVCEKYIALKYGANPTGAQCAEGYGKMLEFDRVAKKRTAEADWAAPEKYIPAMANFAAKDDSGAWFKLADYCWFWGKKDETYRYYKTAMESDYDPIGKANGAWFWIKRLYETGEKAQAEKVARESADVFSHGGLLAMARYCELVGKVDEAEGWLKRSQERYPGESTDQDLGAFYVRHRDDGKYKDEAAAAVKKWFPDGLVQVNSDAELAHDGVKLARVYREGKVAGLAAGQVVVALNGYRVKNKKQLDFVKTLTDGFERKMTLWDGKEYKHVQRPLIYDNLAEYAD